MKMRIVIPGNPKSQKRHRTAKSGHRYDPSSGDKKTLRKELMQIKPATPIGGPVRVDINAWFQTPTSWSEAKKKRYEGKFRPKTPDKDNIEKILYDTMNGYILADDKQIVDGRTRKFYSVEPCTELIIEKIDQTDVD